MTEAFPMTGRMSHKRLRVLHVLESTLGGTLRYLENIEQAMQSNEIDQGLVYGWNRADSRFEPFLERASASGWKLFPIDVRREISLLHDFRCMVELRALLASYKPDLLHCHSSKAGAIGRIAAATIWPRVPVVYSPHALASALGRRYLIIENLLSPFTTRFAAVSSSEREEIAAAGVTSLNNIDVVYPVIDTTMFAPQNKGSARSFLRLHDRPTVIGIGRLVTQKDPLGFLHVVDLVRSVCPNVQAIWLGAGELRDNFLALRSELGLDDAVVLSDWALDIRPYLAAADVLLSTSKFESFGYMVAEAMAMEVPIVATNVAGTRNIVEGGVESALYSVGAYATAAELVTARLFDVEAAVREAALGREIIQQRYGPSQMRISLLSCYHKVLKYEVSVSTLEEAA